MLRQEEIDTEVDIKDDIFIATPYGRKRILKVYRTIPLEVVEITTFSGRKVRCSSHHIFLTNKGCLPANDLRVGTPIIAVDGVDRVADVVHLDKKEVLYDITVDHPSGLFYSNGLVSHNSTTFVARQLINSFVFWGYKSLYVTPLHDQVKTYAAKYLEMESVFRGNTGKQNKYSKVYGRNSSVEMLHCLETANAARGKTVWEVLVDECQGMDPNIIPELEYVHHTSKVPMSIYSGTALTIDSLLELKWQRSSMGMWHVRAGDGKTWLNMYDKDTLFKVCDHPQGPTCPITGKLLNITDGNFVHTNQGALDAGDIGIHIPQCIIPANAYSPVQWGEIYKKVSGQAGDDERKIMQECFGIAIAEGAREITESDLRAICTNTDSEEVTLEKIRKGHYLIVVSGCDWGGSDYNPATKTKTSYSVHCILGLCHNGTVDILYYKRYSGMNYPEIAADIVENHIKYKGNIIVSDYGVGLAYNTEIRNRLPWQQHFVAQFEGPKTAPISQVKNSSLYNHIGINKTEAITAVFTDVKKLSPMRIRAKTWDRMSAYLSDWLNLFRAPTESSAGISSFKYIRAATKADDALMAFVFAYTLIKFYKGEPLVEDKSFGKYLRELVIGATLPVRPMVPTNSIPPNVNLFTYG